MFHYVEFKKLDDGSTHCVEFLKRRCAGQLSMIIAKDPRFELVKSRKQQKPASAPPGADDKREPDEDFEADDWLMELIAQLDC